MITSGITSGAVIKRAEQGLAVEIADTRHHHRRHGAEHDCRAGGGKRQLQADHGRIDHLLVRNSSKYHLVEKPAHTVTSFDSLNE